jgi:hypothetical protein
VERRLEERVDYFARVQISYQLDGGPPTTASGVMEDRSKSGFAVRVAKPIPVGSEVGLSHGANTFRCEIRRCIPSGVEFLLGLLVLPAVDAAE